MKKQNKYKIMNSELMEKLLILEKLNHIPFNKIKFKYKNKEKIKIGKNMN
jgi:hypothetical protein